MTRARLPLAQGGAGLYVDFGGLANLDGCTVFSNEAYVRPPYAPSLSLLQRPAGTFRVLAFSMQAGGGLYVYSGGVANLDGCNVYSNEAQVSARLTPLPGPFLQRPAEVALFLACAQNVVARILNLLDLSSSAPLERFVCSLSACSLALGSTSTVVARPTSMDARCTRIKLLRWVLVF